MSAHSHGITRVTQRAHSHSHTQVHTHKHTQVHTHTNTHTMASGGTSYSPTLGLTITKSLPYCVDEAELNGFLNPSLLPPLCPLSFHLLGQQTLTLSLLKRRGGESKEEDGGKGDIKTMVERKRT